ncbi:metal-dependent hydrolase [Streptacidiphilus sp. MAP5-3]|uniref:metal-dependent hydrolase n=1 Tax=unclassified Streptacidiphilus TaxID=2643834 RepID=UPI0035192A82
MTAPSSALPAASTQVTFPAGAVEGHSVVVGCVPLPDGRHGVVVERTPFHPLDHTWPDQPADTGTLGDQAVLDCVTGGLSPEGELLLGADIPVRRGDAEWSWLVVHVVAEPVAVGEEVDLRVEADRRAALSASHTGCHLLALALNGALAPRWRKDPGRTDSLGSPDFDSLAMDTSRMDTAASYDVYRIGKSLKKKGFTVDGLAEELPAITDAVNARLAAWVAADAEVRIEAPSPELTARREWHASLPEGHASIFCGGSHLHHLGELAALTAELRLNEDGTELTVTTTPKRA